MSTQYPLPTADEATPTPTRPLSADIAAAARRRLDRDATAVTPHARRRKTTGDPL